MIANRYSIDYTKKTITRSREWPYFWLEVCRGHVLPRPWYLRWLPKKRYFHEGQHPRWAGVSLLALYSYLTETWEVDE